LILLLKVWSILNGVFNFNGNTYPVLHKIMWATLNFKIIHFTCILVDFETLGIFSGLVVLHG